VDRDGEGPPRAGAAVVVVGGLRVADQRGRARGGSGAHRDLRRDGRFLVASLCVPAAFDESGLLFACAYGVVRVAHKGLFVLASRDDAVLRRSVVTGLVGSTTIGVGLLVAASFADGPLQGALWGLALALDMAGPVLFGVEGWKIVPGHFAERHGLIVIIALGESIVAIGVGAEAGVGAGVVAAAVLGMVVAAMLWWLYFDVVALVGRAAAGKGRGGTRAERNRPRLLLLPPPSDGGRHRAAGARRPTLGPAPATLGQSDRRTPPCCPLRVEDQQVAQAGRDVTSSPRAGHRRRTSAIRSSATGPLASSRSTGRLDGAVGSPHR